MIKKVLTKIQKLEKAKLLKKDKQKEIQLEIDKIDEELKKLNLLKKNYEKLDKASIELLGGKQNE